MDFMAEGSGEHSPLPDLEHTHTHGATYIHQIYSSHDDLERGEFHSEELELLPSELEVEPLFEPDELEPMELRIITPASSRFNFGVNDARAALRFGPGAGCCAAPGAHRGLAGVRPAWPPMCRIWRGGGRRACMRVP